MEKIWLKHYPPGVPAEIDADAYESVIEIFQQSCEQFHDRPAFYAMGVTLTYGEINQYSLQFAAYLQQVLHLKKGERFAIMLPNLLQYPIAMYGAMRAGLIVVNVNPLYTADELTFQLNNSGAVGLLLLENFAGTVEKALPKLASIKHLLIAKVSDMLPWWKGWTIDLALKYFYKKIPTYHLPNAICFNQVLAKGNPQVFIKPTIGREDIAFLQYTGGTTGISKGAILTHRNLIANIQQADAWFKNLLIPGKEIIITALPLYHIFSLLANALFFFKLGGLNILIINPRDMKNMVKELSRFPFTAITGVNTLFNGLLKNPAFTALNFKSLKLALGGGMAVQRAIAEQWQQVTGAPLLEAYGLTETSPCVTINPPDLKAYNGSIGLPVPSTDIAILDNQGVEVPLQQAGELAVKGPQVMRGYWQNPKETEKVFTPDGWLLTGDIAIVDKEGFVRLLERKKDMILVSGFNVYPNEIEDVLARLPGVRESAVVAMPDENSGEAVKAFIVRENPSLSAEEIVKYCRQHLTPYKIPKLIVFKDDLPKSNVGKILRRELKEQF